MGFTVLVMTSLVLNTFEAGDGGGGAVDAEGGAVDGYCLLDLLPFDVRALIDRFYNESVYQDVMAELRCEVGDNSIPSCWVDRPSLYHKLHSETCRAFGNCARGNINILTWWLEHEPRGSRLGIECDLYVRIAAETILHTWNNSYSSRRGLGWDGMGWGGSDAYGIEAFCLMFDYQTLLDLKRCMRTLRWSEE